MSSPIFDSTFGTGRFRYEEPMTTDPTTSPSPEPQDVREALADLIFAAEQYLDFDGDRRAIPDLIRRAKEKGKAALAQSDAGRSLIKGERGGISWGGSFYVEGNKESVDAVRAAHDAQERCKYLDKMISEKQLVRPAPPDASAGLIEAAEWLMERAHLIGGMSARSYREAASALRFHAANARGLQTKIRAADRSVHGELIPDCPTDGVAARQGNGG